ncbi:MAG: response regulator [Candidatus Omnitrophica bacterium]|nr:response regulator [Candidatus Omnitrophota bacterium]
MWKKIVDFFNGRGSKVSQAVGKSILVVDDGEVELKFLSHTLEKRGYMVKTAKDGEEAFDLANAGDYDLYLLDFCMPKMDGRELCEKLKKTAKTRDVPVIFLTGSANPTDLVNCYDAGAEYYLEKPIGAGALIKQIEMIFSQLKDIGHTGQQDIVDSPEDED